MTDPVRGSPEERLARLEEQMSSIDRDIDALKEQVQNIRSRNEEAAVNNEKVWGLLQTLTDNLGKHETWHKEQGDKKYKITDIILALGMLALTFMEFLK